jgi:D-serine deaminase-like pyridoxal phosphate-dependent protein
MLDALETPALLLDLDAMEANLEKMAAFFRGRTTALRPHYKNHKCVALARRQLAAGAIGVTCATLREAGVLADHGIPGILIANEIAGAVKIRQFLDLAQRADVTLAVDHPDVVRALAAHRSPVKLLVDVDVGLDRCGVASAGEALRLAREIIGAGLIFRGLMGYEGRIKSREACEAAMARLAGCRSLLEQNGIPVEIVSAGGSGSYKIAGQYPGITEIQAGSYVVMDTDYGAICPDFAPVLRLLATVISKTEGRRFVLDAGLKSLSGERGLPMLKDMPGARLRKLSAEHAIVDILDASAPVHVGDRIEIRVHYGDATINLHDRMYGVRRGCIEEVFAIEG